jgi:hypothetical protein
LAAQTLRLSLLDLPSLNLDADIAMSMDRIVEASGLSRVEAVERINTAGRRYGVRLAAGSARELGLATFEKWLNPNEAEYVPSVRALNLFCHVFGSSEPLDILAKSHGMGWRVIGSDDAKLLELAKTERQIKALHRRKRKIEAEL